MISVASEFSDAFPRDLGDVMVVAGNRDLPGVAKYGPLEHFFKAILM